MKYFISICVGVVLLFTGCNENQSAAEASRKGNVITEVDLKGKVFTKPVDDPQAPIRLEYFPSQISNFDDCTLRYTYDSVELSPETHIFRSEQLNSAMIRVHGKDILLERQRTETKYPEDHFISIYSNDEYRATLEVKKVESVRGDSYKGTLKIVRGERALIIWVKGRSTCFKNFNQ
jgi:hypothetical protein